MQYTHTHNTITFPYKRCSPNFSVCTLTDKALMAPNLDSFGRDRNLYQEHVKRRTAEREARR